MYLVKTRDKSRENMARTLRDMKVRGTPFSAHDASSVHQICGEIGDTHEPSHYARFPMCRVYVLCRDKEDVVGYAAVRLARCYNFVIDAFGILEEHRQSGLGAAFYGAIEADIRGPWNGKVESPKAYTICIQSTYEQDSYASAVSHHLKCENQDVSVSLMDVSKELRGACVFWRRMGFENERLACTYPGSLFTPVLLMWKHINGDV
jgi:GNAT superfamily N-acetyltransferase